MIYAVVPSNRPERLAEFRRAWVGLFAKHKVHLVVAEDGEHPKIKGYTPAGELFIDGEAEATVLPEHHDLFCNFTDAVRNYGFAFVAKYGDAEFVLTLDDDVAPPPGKDPIAEHLSVMGRQCSTTVLNTWSVPDPPHDDLYARGHPDHARYDAVVMLSHGVWTNVPDFDGRTQVRLESSPGGIPPTMPYHRMPVPKGIPFLLCGMNVMVHRDALPYFYFAPMGPKGHGLNRFADIWMGFALKAAFDRKGWACYTGASTVVHTRASDARKNEAAEAEALALNENYYDMFLAMQSPGWVPPGGDRHTRLHPYWADYAAKRTRYSKYIKTLLEKR